MIDHNEEKLEPFTVVLESPQFGVITVDIKAHCPLCAVKGSISEAMKRHPDCCVQLCGIFRGTITNLMDEVMEAIGNEMKLKYLESNAENMN